MQYLLDTTQTVPPGVGFDMFGLTHLLWLVFFLVFAVCSCLLYRSLRSTQREKMRLIFAALLVADEIFKYIILTVGDRWLADYLPLHLCSVNIFLIAFHAVRPNKLLDNFLYTVCIPAAVAAMLFFTWTCLPFLNFIHLHSFTVHILLAVYPMMLLSGGDIVRDIRKVPHCIGILLIMAAINFAVNLALDTNFMFLMYAPEGNPLYWFQQTFGNHFIGFPVLIAAVVAVMYLPSVRQLKERFGKKHAKV